MCRLDPPAGGWAFFCASEPPASRRGLDMVTARDLDGETMRDHAEQWVGSVLRVDHDLERAFEAAMNDSLSLVFRVAFGVLRHRADAEDVTQEALARAYRNFHKLRDRKAFRAWLVRITWRLALNRQRSDRRRAAREALDAPIAASSTTADEIEQSERAAQLWAAIDALPPKLRLVTVLAGIEEHDICEVASLLRIPEGTVKSRLFLARRQLKELLQWTRSD
jgi:RNA polymerase sigma-70 factor (ECF subfamily)